MQDIRPELRERIKQIQDKRETARQELAELDGIENSLQTVLNSENAIWKRLNPTLPLFTSLENSDSQHSGEGGTLPALLLEFMRGNKRESWTLAQLKEELEQRGYPFGGKAPGRVINFALVGLLNRKSVKKREDGGWQL